MELKKHNLLSKADPYVRQVAKEYLPRPKFAFEQHLSDAVALKHLYSDDVDICFVFEVDGTTVEIYSNYGNPVETGFVHGTDADEAASILEDHFGITVAETLVQSTVTYFAAVPQMETAQ